MEKKKSWFAGHRISIGVLACIVLVVVIAGCSGNKSTDQSGSNASSQEAAAQNSEPAAQPTKTNSYDCLSLPSMKLQNYDAVMQTWTAQVFPYKAGNAEVVYTYNSQIEEKKNVIYCDAGSQEGQNANWVYCGDFLRPIVVQYTDGNGVIVKKRSVQVTFDKTTKEYLKTICDAYELM